VQLGARAVQESTPNPVSEEEKMSNSTTFEDFSFCNRLRCEAANGFNHKLEAWSNSDWFTAILGELGEAANVAKKLNRIRDGIPGNKETEQELRDKLRQELGDVFVYLDLLAQRNGFLIGDAALEVFRKKSKEIGYDD
jgi:NTP pyrophosphatase (non-canonical NTP hydrolase)